MRISLTGAQSAAAATHLKQYVDGGEITLGKSFMDLDENVLPGILSAMDEGARDTRAKSAERAVVSKLATAKDQRDKELNGNGKPSESAIRAAVDSCQRPYVDNEVSAATYSDPETAADAPEAVDTATVTTTAVQGLTEDLSGSELPSAQSMALRAMGEGNYGANVRELLSTTPRHEGERPTRYIARLRHVFYRAGFDKAGDKLQLFP